MQSMFDKKKTINEDDTGIPYLSLGGVFTKDVSSLSKYVDSGDKMKLRKAIIDLFTLHPEVTDDMVHKLANNLKMEPDVLENEIYSIMTSFFNRGTFVKNPNKAIDPDQLRKGITVEMEHTDCPMIAERIARDHLSEGDALYYSHLDEMEQRYQGK